MKPYILVGLSIAMLAFTSPASSISSELKEFRYMSDDVQFDQKDYWQTPEEFLSSKVGDCEDFAVYAKSILDKRGIKSFIFGSFKPGNAHVVLVFKDGSDWYYLNLDYVKKIKGDTLSDLASEIRPGWIYAGIMRQEGHNGIFSRRFNNHEQANVSIDSILKEN